MIIVIVIIMCFILLRLFAIRQKCVQQELQPWSLINISRKEWKTKGNQNDKEPNRHKLWLHNHLNII